MVTENGKCEDGRRKAGAPPSLSNSDPHSESLLCLVLYSQWTSLYLRYDIAALFSVGPPQVLVSASARALNRGVKGDSRRWLKALGRAQEWMRITQAVWVGEMNTAWVFAGVSALSGLIL